MEKSKVINIIVSVVVSVFIWAYVINTTNPVTEDTIEGVPVKLLNIQSLTDQGLAISGSGEYTVDVVLSGARNDLLETSSGDISATADLTGLHMGQNYINVSVQAPSNLSISEVRTSSIQVYVDSRAETEMPVKLVQSGNPENTELGSICIEPETVQLYGAAGIVDTVRQLRLDLDLSGVEAGTYIDGAYKLTAVDAGGEPVIGVSLSHNSVNVSGTLYPTKRMALDVPLTGQLAENLELISDIIPQAITVKGDASLLNALWTISAEEIDLSAITGSCSLPVTPILDKGLEVANEDSRLTADFEIISNLDLNFDFSFEEIEFTAVPDGKSPVPVSDTVVTVTVHGRETLLENFSKDNISLIGKLQESETVNEGEHLAAYLTAESSDEYMDKLTLSLSQDSIMLQLRDVLTEGEEETAEGQEPGEDEADQSESAESTSPPAVKSGN